LGDFGYGTVTSHVHPSIGPRELAQHSTVQLISDGVTGAVRFRNGGEEAYFIGSADCMKRNLESRVEVVVPIEDPLRRKELRAILDTQLSGDCGEWEMQPDGRYIQRTPADGYRNCQPMLIELSDTQQREAGRLRKRRPKGVARRAIK
jgi:polyphosphate kinase